MTTIGASGPLADIIVTVNEKKRLIPSRRVDEGAKQHGRQRVGAQRVRLGGAAGLNMEPGSRNRRPSSLAPRGRASSAPMPSSLQRSPKTAPRTSSTRPSSRSCSAAAIRRLGSAHRAWHAHLASSSRAATSASCRPPPPHGPFCSSEGSRRIVALAHLRAVAARQSCGAEPGGQAPDRARCRLFRSATCASSSRPSPPPRTLPSSRTADSLLEFSSPRAC